MPLAPRLQEHFDHPRRAGRLEGATGTGRAENPACGDVVEVFVRVEDGAIADATFLAHGCPATIAGASFVLDHAVGWSVADVVARDADGWMALAGETSAARRHGLAMAARAVAEAVG